MTNEEFPVGDGAADEIRLERLQEKRGRLLGDRRVRVVRPSAFTVVVNVPFHLADAAADGPA